MSDINSPRNVTVGSGRREWIPSCSANLQISLETDRNGGIEEWLDQAASAPGELGEAVPERRETDKALCMSLVMVCKSDALNVVKTVTHKRGFESWRKMCKECGSTTGTSLHEYSNLLEYDFGTTDGFTKKLLKWENQIVDFQKATGEVFSVKLKNRDCVVEVSRTNQNVFARSESRRLRSSSNGIDKFLGS